MKEALHQRSEADAKAQRSDEEESASTNNRKKWSSVSVRLEAMKGDARKASASSPPPLGLASPLSGTSGWLGGVPVRGALAAQNKMDF